MLQVMGCTLLYPDLKAAMDRLGLAGLLAFPARCGRPPLALSELPGQGLIIGGPCLSCLDPGDICFQSQCFYHVCPKPLVDQFQKNGGYLMTPGWLVSWKDRIREWGFDRPTARDFFKDTELVLLDTFAIPDIQQHLDQMAQYLGRPARVVPLGLDHLALVVEREWVKRKYQQACQDKAAAEKQAADHALVQDMLNRLPGTMEEADVIDALKELFTLLTAPKAVTYVPCDGLARLKAAQDPLFQAFLKNEKDLFHLDEKKTGVYLKVIGSQSMIGLLRLTALAFPVHMTHYLNIAINITGIFGLAIEHVRMVKDLMDASLAAGKAELATEMLHNVGNVLNSVNISAEQIRQRLALFPEGKIRAVADLLKAQNLPQFLAQDSRGVKLPLFLEKLDAKIQAEIQGLIQEADSQLRKIKIIADIISSQQELAGCRPIQVRTDISAVVEESLNLMDSRMKTHHIDVIRDFHPLPMIISQRGKLLQILLNLISNAVDALIDNSPDDRKIRICHCHTPQTGIMISITDNGCGMGPETLAQVFSYGFSTKKDGHGFGLHNAANLATQLKGRLLAHSPGSGQGSTFTITLPSAFGSQITEKEHEPQTHPHH